MARVNREVRERLRSPADFWLFFRITIWGLGLRLLRPFMSVHRLVKLALPSPGLRAIRSTRVLNCLELLDRTGLLARSGDCLPRALVCYRFLTLAALEPSLFIGFDRGVGHAWVELAGEPFLETRLALHNYCPTLVLYPEGSTLEKISTSSSYHAKS